MQLGQAQGGTGLSPVTGVDLAWAAAMVDKHTVHHVTQWSSPPFFPP